jgi:hypothetical protein
MSVEIEKLQEMVRDSGLKLEEQAAFYKVSMGGRAIYIAKTKKVSRVDLSGFDFSHPAVRKVTDKEAKELKLGKVRAQLDFSKTEERVLEAFKTGLTLLKHLAGEPARGNLAKQIKQLKPHVVEAGRGRGRPSKTVAAETPAAQA